MSDDELRAVADRLRRLKAGKELSQDIYGIEVPPRESRAEYLTACHAVKASIVRDERTAVAAFLESHPADDGEPVTREWLQDRRFAPEPTHEFEGGPVNVWVLRDEHGEPVLTLDCIDSRPDEWDAFFGAIEDWNQFPRSMVTRGDVRRLLAALGIAG